MKETDDRLAQSTDEFIAKNEEEALEMVARTGFKVQESDEVPMELTDEERHMASGGKPDIDWDGSLGPENERFGPYKVGDSHYIKGDLYLTSHATGYCGRITGYYVLQRYVAGRNAPYLLKTNAGWVKATAIDNY